MSEEAALIALANRDQAALDRLVDSEGHAEWIATIAFYKALHIVDAIFEHNDIGRPDGHNYRLTELKRGRRFLPIYQHYRPLWNASSIARYLYDRETRAQYASFAQFMPADKVAERLIRGRLFPIETCARSWLSPEAYSQLQRASAR